MEYLLPAVFGFLGGVGATGVWLVLRVYRRHRLLKESAKRWDRGAYQGLRPLKPGRERR